MKNGPYTLVVPPAAYPGKRYRNRYAYEHRVNWWKSTGCNPDDYDAAQIHHKDEDTRNNAPHNLKLMSESAHKSLHARPISYNEGTCVLCGVRFTRRKGQKLPKHCSRQCYRLNANK